MSIERAYLRIDVRCTMDDQTAIPTNMSFSCGEPDEDGIIEYTCGDYIDAEMLSEIFSIILNRGKQKCEVEHA